MIKIKHLIKPRQFGKTYDCITESAKTGAIIVAKDIATCRQIHKSAMIRGLTIPKPLSAKQIINAGKNKDLDLSGAHFIVDDADSILYQLLGCHPIDTISMVSRDHDGYEEMSGKTKALMGLDSECHNTCPDDKECFGFVRGTTVIMADGTYKNIEDIIVGDMVLGIPRSIEDFNDPHGDDDHPYHCLDNYIPSRVLSTHIRYDIETISVWYKYGGEYEEMFRVSPKHKFLTCDGVYMSIQDIIHNNESYIHIRYQNARMGLVSTQMGSYELELKPGKKEVVYHLGTETGTYIAGNGVVL